MTGQTGYDTIRTKNHNKPSSKGIGFPIGKGSAAPGKIKACFYDHQAKPNSAQGYYPHDYTLQGNIILNCLHIEFSGQQ